MLRHSQRTRHIEFERLWDQVIQWPSMGWVGKCVEEGSSLSEKEPTAPTKAPTILTHPYHYWDPSVWSQILPSCLLFPLVLVLPLSIPFSFKEGSMASRILVLKDVPILIPKACEYVTLQDQKDFGDVIISKTLEMEGYLGLSEWRNVIRRVHPRGRQEGQNQRRRCDNKSKGYSDRDCWEETWYQGTQTVSESWKRQGTDSP